MKKLTNEDIIRITGDLEGNPNHINDLGDDELAAMSRYYFGAGFRTMGSDGKLQFLMSEISSRNASKVAKTGVMLAWVAVGVGVIQVILELCQR